jgi:hypothetical protein
VFGVVFLLVFVFSYPARPPSVARRIAGRPVDEEMLSRNVARLVQLRVTDERRVRSFTRAEALRFLEAAEHHRLYALWTVALSALGRPMDCPRARRASRAAVRRSRPNSNSSSARLANTPATIRPVAFDVSIPSRRNAAKAVGTMARTVTGIKAAVGPRALGCVTAAARRGPVDRLQAAVARCGAA